MRVRHSILRHASSGRNVGKCVRSGMTATRDDDGDRASGKLLSDIGDDDNESYAGVTLCLEGISSRNWKNSASLNILHSCATVRTDTAAG